MRPSDDSSQPRAVEPPLKGLRVIEVANYVSGPYATLMLADLGAEVTKIEPPRGDPLRRFGRPATALSAPFVNANRGKCSITVDLKTTEGRHSLLSLLQDADIFLSNWRPNALQRAG